MHKWSGRLNNENHPLEEQKEEFQKRKQFEQLFGTTISIPIFAL